MTSCLVCKAINKGKEFPTPSQLSKEQIKNLCGEHKVKLLKILNRYIKILNTKTRTELNLEQIKSRKILKLSFLVMTYLAKEGSQTTEKIYQKFSNIPKEYVNEVLYELVRTTYVVRHDFKGLIRYKMNPDTSPIAIEVIG